MSLATSINVAIVGFSGAIGRRHTSEVLSNPSTNLIALVDPSAAAPSIAAVHSVPYFKSIHDLLTSITTPKLDAAIICTPNHTHVGIAKELAAAGIHLLVEKPISVSPAEGQELIPILRDNGVRLLVGHQRRFNRHVIATKKAIDEGLLGDITAVSALWTNYKPLEYFIGGAELFWRSSHANGGGVVMINLVHEIDLLQYFLGPITKVHAEKTVSRRKSDGVPVDDNDRAEEGAALTLRFQSGTVGNFLLSDHVVSPYNYEAATRENPVPLSALEGEERDVYRIFGTEASLTVPDMVLWSYGASAKKGWLTELQKEKIPVDDDPRAPFARQLDHFVQVVRGEAEPNCSLEEGLQAVLVCDIIKRALASPSGTMLVPEPDIEGLSGSYFPSA